MISSSSFHRAPQIASAQLRTSLLASSSTSRSNATGLHRMVADHRCRAGPPRRCPLWARSGEVLPTCRFENFGLDGLGGRRRRGLNDHPTVRRPCRAEPTRGRHQRGNRSAAGSSLPLEGRLLLTRTISSVPPDNYERSSGTHVERIRRHRPLLPKPDASARHR